MVNHKRVERLMGAHGIVGVHKAARVRTTSPAGKASPLPDLIGRRFTPGRPDVAWVGDIAHKGPQADVRNLRSPTSARD